MDLFFSLSFKFDFSYLAINKYMFELPSDIGDGYMIYIHYVVYNFPWFLI